MYGAYFSYSFVLHKYTVIVSASSFSARFPPQPDRRTIAATIIKRTDKALFHFFFFIILPLSGIACQADIRNPSPQLC